MKKADNLNEKELNNKKNNTTKKKNDYGNESIKKLRDIDTVRKKTSVIFGSNDITGCEHSFFEILSNSVDEFKSGFGNTINIRKNKDNIFVVQDFGRGCPVDFNKNEGVYNWELIFCTLFAGGKYDDEDESIYQDKLGTNGVGTASTQLASEFFDAIIVRDGYEYKLHFEKGVNIGGLQKKKLKKVSIDNNDDEIKTGTTLIWKPDLEVFTDIDLSLDYLKYIAKQQSIINAGLHINLYDEESNESFEFFYPDGILGYVTELNDSKGITTPYIFNASGEGMDKSTAREKANIINPKYSVKFSFAFTFNNLINTIEYYHNSSFLEYGGAPDKALRKAFTDVIDSQLSKNNMYNKSERRIKFEDINDSLICVCNSFSSRTSYEHQTKKAIKGEFIQSFMTEKIKENLEVWFVEHKLEAEKVLKQILVNKRSAESAEQVRLASKKKLTSTVNTLTNRIEKFVPCRTKDRNLKELYICEGDSAASSIIQARNSFFQAIMPIRGKILNCLKCDYKTIMKSELVMDLIRLFGCGMEIHDKHIKNTNLFNINNFDWNKIIIATDADVDGFQIRTLVLAMIYRLCPELIKQGYVYIVETPLFEVTVYEKGNETTFYAFNDSDMNKLLKKIKNKKYKIQRSKGLGENDPEMMWETTLNPENRYLVKVTMDDNKIANETFDLLLGNNLEGRKNYIEEFGYLYMDDADIV